MFIGDYEDELYCDDCGLPYGDGDKCQFCGSSVALTWNELTREVIRLNEAVESGEFDDDGLSDRDYDYISEPEC